MSSITATRSDEGGDTSEDAAFNARAYLKRAADEFKETKEKHDGLTKQFDEVRAAAAGKNMVALDRALDAVKYEKAGESDRIEKLVKDAQKFLEGEHCLAYILGDSRVSLCPSSGFELKLQFEEMHQLSGIYSYVSVIRCALDIGDQLKLHYENGEWPSFIRLFSKELDEKLVQRLSKSSCSNLHTWIAQYANSWRYHGSARISTLIAERLETANIPQDVLHADQRLTDEIKPLAQCLLDLAATNSKETEPLSVVANALLHPFVKRYIYHFCGGKGEQAITGGGVNPAMVIKPEWYLSVAVKWHREFTDWIGRLELEEPGKNTKTGKATDVDTGSALSLFFARGLVDLARKRMKADLLQYAQEDPSVLPHLIDEAIAFDTDIKGMWLLILFLYRSTTGSVF